MQLDGKGKVEAYRAKVKLSFKYESSWTEGVYAG
jgi:hypothetical protein